MIMDCIYTVPFISGSESCAVMVSGGALCSWSRFLSLQIMSQSLAAVYHRN
uniref:Uncharacterized protein n=1 Tax=Anguilla anguilla TaxID=7936 RepID=A0A0E9UST6_ANGAN